MHLDWFDMTTGLIEGWQHLQDDLRADNPLLPPATWLRALNDAGFADSMALLDGASIAARSWGNTCIVARRRVLTVEPRRLATEPTPASRPRTSADAGRCSTDRCGRDARCAAVLDDASRRSAGAAA